MPFIYLEESLNNLKRSKMTHKLIHTPNYLLVVDDSEIKEGDYCLMFDDFGNLFLGNLPSQYLGEKNGHHLNKGLKKIIAHLPLNNSPILEGVDLLPPLKQEDDVDELAKEYGESIGNKDGTAVFDYKRGYNKAKENYKYTEEDMREAMFLYAGWITGGVPSLRIAKTAEERQGQIFQSLSQTKIPVAFECEEKVSSDSMYVNHVIYETKTITTSKGHTQWVGKYKKIKSERIKHNQK